MAKAKDSSQERIIGVRLDASLTSRIQSFEDSTGVSAATMGRELFRAMLDSFEANGQIAIPFAVLPKRDLEILHTSLNKARAGGFALIDEERMKRIFGSSHGLQDAPEEPQRATSARPPLPKSGSSGGKGKR